MSRESATDEPVEVLVDEYSTAILTATSAEPITVNEWLDDLDMSRATAYRRINQLLACDLLDEQTRIDATGTQYHVYEANFQTLKIEIINGISYLHIVYDNDHNITQIWEYK